VVGRLGRGREDHVEAVSVELKVDVPDGTPEVEQRTRAEASAAARLADEGHLDWCPMTRLPEPRLTRVHRLEAALGEPLDLGDVSQGHRRIVALTGGTLTGPELNGKLLTQIETASRDLDWLNKGVFISVGGRGPGGVIYETYLVA
jgi:hypothetical protein